MAQETKTITLPSKGKITEGVSEVTIRNMTGADEKIIYSGVSTDSIDKLLKKCIVEPENINVAELCEQDKYFILMQIRILTFGSLYRFETTCPECGTRASLEIDLDDLEVFYADAADFDESLKCKLPNEEEVEFKIITSKEVKEVRDRLAKLKQQNDKGTQMILRLASIIKSINGEEKTLSEKQRWLEESSSRIINILWRKFGQIKLGVNLATYMDCPGCNQTVEVGVVMNAEFFRPVDDSI